MCASLTTARCATAPDPTPRAPTGSSTCIAGAVFIDDALYQYIVVRAIRSVYEAGMQFQGDIDIPIIDWRHYLGDDLDMHNSQQSFTA